MKKFILTMSAFLTVTSFVYAADSAGNRADSIVMIAPLSTGIHLPSIAAPPIRLGVLLGPDWMVGLDVGSNEYSRSDGTSKATATYSNQGLFGRYFIGNSFNVLAGYHMRNYDASVTSTDSSGTATFDLKAQANVLTFTLANHWLMDWGLWIGYDWLLLSSTVSESSEATVTRSGSIGDIKRAEKDTEEIGKFVNAISGSSGFLVLTLGFAF